MNRQRRKLPVRTARATAMTELIFCLFPHILILVVALVFWHLLLGKQEAVKYFTSASLPGDGTVNSSDFFGNLKGTATINDVQLYSFGDDAAESSFNTLVGISSDDEPVLPYKSDGSDFERAIELAGTRVYYDQKAGGYKVGLGETGRRLSNLGFLTADTKTVYSDPTQISVTVSQSELLKSASQAMGEWIAYRSASANYAYVAPFKLGNLPGGASAASTNSWQSANGIKAFSQDAAAYWPVVSNPGLRAWSSMPEVTAAINALFSSVFTSTINTLLFSDAATYQQDKSVIPSYSGGQ